MTGPTESKKRGQNAMFWLKLCKETKTLTSRNILGSVLELVYKN
jgi:hypothetical protein